MTDDRADPPPIPSEIRALVARYHEHRETYKQQTYNETQARREFIDPVTPDEIRIVEEATQ